MFQNQNNFTDGALFHLLPKIVDYEGNSPLKRSEVVLISPPFQDLKFSIFRANAESGYDYYLRCDEEFATLKNLFPEGEKLALSVILEDSSNVKSLPAVIFIRFWVPGVYQPEEAPPDPHG